MPTSQHYDPRKELVKVMIAKVAGDTHPSITMMNMIEAMLEPDEVPAYVDMLLDRLRRDHFPSIPMMRRIQKLS